MARCNKGRHVRQVLQKLRSGTALVEEAPGPMPRAGHLRAAAGVTRVPTGPERIALKGIRPVRTTLGPMASRQIRVEHLISHRMQAVTVLCALVKAVAQGGAAPERGRGVPAAAHG
jgi:hypothetical protein